ncbi:epoxide hydrolase N-terminal domain-containing protein [Micromonospora sp. CPCC 205371]|nr:epoxide hydrolase N-terminal domain-containing protein [Micromonospora sp. CPCC 205371]
MTPFRIDIPRADFDDLRERLARARRTRQLPGDGWSRGVPVEHLRELATYWGEMEAPAVMAADMAAFFAKVR